MELVSYGSVSRDFRVIAQMRKLLKRIQNQEIPEHRIDCYSVDSLESLSKDSINIKFSQNSLKMPENIEVFCPSENYPSHTDSGGISYFIGLESGLFTIGGTSYPIVPFVLYSFEDSKSHNTDFGAIMLK